MGGPLAVIGHTSMGRAFAVLVVALVVIAIVKGMRGGRAIGSLPVMAKPLMTPMERRTIGYIEAAVPQARVHAQVSMGALMRAKPGLSRSIAQTTRNRFSSRIVDYVLEDRVTGRIMALVELDDRYHNAATDRDRDRLTAKAGYLTIRLPKSETPTMMNVARRVRSALFDDDMSIGAADPIPHRKTEGRNR